MTPAGTSNELDVQNEWEENTHYRVNTVDPSTVVQYSNSIKLVDYCTAVYRLKCRKRTNYLSQKGPDLHTMSFCKALVL